MNSNDLNTLLEKWYLAKKQISELGANCKKYKNVINKINVNGDKMIESDEYVLNIKNQSRKTINKRDMPEEVWDRYSRVNSFDCYYLKKKRL